MTKILGISGSLRKASFNTGLMRAAAENVPGGVDFDAATLHGIPLYDGAGSLPPSSPHERTLDALHRNTFVRAWTDRLKTKSSL